MSADAKPPLFFLWIFTYAEKTRAPHSFSLLPDVEAASCCQVLRFSEMDGWRGVAVPAVEMCECSASGCLGFLIVETSGRHVVVSPSSLPLRGSILSSCWAWKNPASSSAFIPSFPSCQTDTSSTATQWPAQGLLLFLTVLENKSGSQTQGLQSKNERAYRSHIKEGSRAGRMDVWGKRGWEEGKTCAAFFILFFAAKQHS